MCQFFICFCQDKFFHSVFLIAHDGQSFSQGQWRRIWWPDESSVRRSDGFKNDYKNDVNATIICISTPMQMLFVLIRLVNWVFVWLSIVAKIIFCFHIEWISSWFRSKLRQMFRNIMLNAQCSYWEYCISDWITSIAVNSVVVFFLFMLLCIGRFFNTMNVKIVKQTFWIFYEFNIPCESNKMIQNRVHQSKLTACRRPIVVGGTTCNGV